MEQNQQRQIPPGPISVPQPSTPEMQWVYQRINQHEQVLAELAKYDIRAMSGGKVALVAGGLTIAMVGIGFGTAALYKRWTTEEPNQPKTK